MNIHSFSCWLLSTVIVLMLFAPAGLSAQDKNEEVTIIAPYRPTVSTANKINRNPRIVPLELQSLPVMEYSIRSERINTQLTPEGQKPSRVPGEPSKDLYRSHIRAGFGNYATPYLELWVNSLQSDEFNAGAHIRHISSFGQIKDYAKSSFSNTSVSAYATKYFNEHTLEGSIGYDRNMVHHYGFMPDDFPGLSINDDDLKQVFQKVNFELGLSSNKTEDDAFNYYMLLDGYYFFDKYKSNETNILFNPGLVKKLDIFDNGRSQDLGLDLKIDYFMNNDTISNYNGGILSATPFFNMDLEPYRIYIGVKADYRMDTASKFHLYPIIRAEANLLEDMLVIYAGIEGGLSRVSFESLGSENLFINSIIPMEYSNHKFDFYGGVKGRLTEIFDFNLGLKYSSVENMPMFVNDSSNILGNTFDVVYDKAGIFRIYGEFGFRSKSDFGLLLRAGYNSYSMDKEEKPWHLPAFDASLETYYILKEKLTLKANLNAKGGMFARTFEQNQLVAKQLNTWIDLGIGAEYNISKQFSAFLNLNNLLNNGYFKWDQYPVQKFNVMAGVGFSF